MRQPLQPGGRGTSPIMYLAATTAIACSKANRLSSGRDCLLCDPSRDVGLRRKPISVDLAAVGLREFPGGEETLFDVPRLVVERGRPCREVGELEVGECPH